MRSGAAFSIGKTHSVCQDYATASPPGAGTGFCVLSDGCSGAPDTDIGARLIARSCAKVFRECALSSLTSLGLATEVMRHAVTWRIALGLPYDALDATCLAVAGNGDLVKAFVLGDGWLFAERRDGAIELFRSSFVTAPRSISLPLYPSSLWREFSYDGILREFDLESWELSIAEARLSVNDEWTDGADSRSRVERGQFQRPYFFSARDYRLIGVLSDGADSFMQAISTGTSRQVAAVPFSEVAAKLLRFPQTDGDFVGMRMHAFEKRCAKEGLSHSDDLSMAVVAFDEEDA